MTDPATLYTPEEVADLLKVSKNMVYELINTKELYAKKVGRVYRIPAAAIDYFTHNLDYHTLVVRASQETGQLRVPHILPEVSRVDINELHGDLAA